MLSSKKILILIILSDYNLKLVCVRYFFYEIFIFSPNVSPAKTMKNVFYFI